MTQIALTPDWVGTTNLSWMLGDPNAGIFSGDKRPTNFIVTAATISGSVLATDLTINVSVASPFNIGMPMRVDSEYMLVTNVAGTVLTVTRGYYGTAAATHAIGATTYINGTIIIADINRTVQFLDSTGQYLMPIEANLIAGRIDGVDIGDTTPAAGHFTTISASQNTAALLAGNVGTMLQIGNADGTNTRVAIDASAAISALDFRRLDNTVASPAAVGTGEVLGRISYLGYNGSAYGNAAQIDGVTTQAWGASAQGGSLVLRTTPNNSTTATQALKLDQDQSATFASTIKAIHAIGGSAAPTAAVGAAAGTGATITSPVAGTDMAGLVNITTGTATAANGVLCTITFNVAYGAAPNVLLFPASQTAADLLSGALAVYVTTGTGNFVINTGTTAPTISTNFKWYYVVVQ